MFYKKINKYEVAAKFNNVIYIVKEESTINKNGFKEHKYTTIKQVRANVVGLSSKEYFVNNNTNLKTIKKIRIRYDKNIDSNYLIKYKEDIYKIIETININEEDLYLELICQNIKDCK